jgi:glycerol kinase
VVNALLMQFQSDILNVPVLRPRTIETTALGAAYAAGLAVGYWQDTDDLVRNWGVTHTWTPALTQDRRASLTASWHKAIARSFDWA